MTEPPRRTAAPVHGVEPADSAPREEGPPDEGAPPSETGEARRVDSVLSPAHVHLLAMAARAHVLAAEAERCIAEVAELLDADQVGGSATAGVLIRDARLRARIARATAHGSTGDTAAAATGLAIALRRLSEFADLHRQARESIVALLPHDAQRAQLSPRDPRTSGGMR